MKFKLVENLIDELDLISDSLIDELKNKFGNDFDSKPLCREVTKYIEDKLDVKGLYYNVIVFSKESGIISNNGHCVIYHNKKVYDYTSNQYSHYEGIEKIDYCPRVLTYDEEMSTIFGMKCYSQNNYVIAISEEV